MGDPPQDFYNVVVALKREIDANTTAMLTLWSILMMRVALSGGPAEADIVADLKIARSALGADDYLEARIIDRAIGVFNAPQGPGDPVRRLKLIRGGLSETKEDGS
jgi:hypothetical protein